MVGWVLGGMLGGSIGENVDGMAHCSGGRQDGR
jgi:hypothetical protein